MCVGRVHTPACAFKRPRRLEEGIKSPGAGITAGNELWVLGTQLQTFAKVPSALKC